MVCKSVLFRLKINFVSYLQRNKFSLLPYEVKLKIKHLGKLTNLKLLAIVAKKIFCFSCILFGGDKSWTITSVLDLGHLSQSIRKRSKKTSF